MNDDAFLATIRERPNDSGPLLVYADWLEETGATRCSEQIRNYLHGEKGMIQFPGKVGDKVLICTVTLCLDAGDQPLPPPPPKETPR